MGELRTHRIVAARRHARVLVVFVIVYEGHVTVVGIYGQVGLIGGD